MSFVKNHFYIDVRNNQFLVFEHFSQNLNIYFFYNVDTDAEYLVFEQEIGNIKEY